MAGIGSTPSLIVGVGIGGAVSAAFAPKVEIPKQEAWARNPVKLPDVGLIAQLVATGDVSETDGRAMANRLGFSDGTLDSLTYLAQTRPDFPLMLRLWRRFGAFDADNGAAIEALLDQALAHAGLDWDYHDLLKRLRTAELVGIGDIGYGVVRGILPAPSWVPVAPPAKGDKVPRFPQVEIDPVQLAAALGYDENMLRLIVGRSGLSMAPVMAAQAHFREIIGPNDFLLAIAEGDLRTEWAESVLEVAREIPTADTYMESALRGWNSIGAARAGAARHGMTETDADLLYKVHRRPLPVATVTKALARGGVFKPQPGEIEDPYSASVHQANLGPEWYDLAEHMKYSYPSAFVLRALLKDGAVKEAEAVAILTYEGWPPDLAEKVAKAYAPSATAASDPHVTKAQGQLWTQTHKSFLAYETSTTDATTALGVAGVAETAIPDVLQIWTTERSLIRKGLSAAQIKKAVAAQTVNPATGVAWTEQDALARLQELGFGMEDATTYLSE